MADDYAFERKIALMAEWYGGPIQQQSPAELRLNVKSALRMHRQSEAYKKTVDEIGEKLIREQQADMDQMRRTLQGDLQRDTGLDIAHAW